MTDPILYHLLIVLGGILCVRWGFLLFSSTPYFSDSNGEYQPLAALEASLSHLAPATFMTILGAAILICCLTIWWRIF
jgi:hypothetical protein